MCFVDSVFVEIECNIDKLYVGLVKFIVDGLI